MQNALAAPSTKQGPDMRLHYVFLLLILGLITAFAALNWSAFITPTDLSLGFTSTQMPLGLLLLGLLAVLTTLFLIFAVYMEGTALLESRRQTRELRANRELADQAEASRFTELRAFLVAELAKQAQQHTQSQAALLSRLDRLEQDMRAFTEQSGNTLAAYIGELEDRLDQTGTPRAEG